MIDKEKIKHIASLARLKVDDSEVEKFSKDLSAILDYVAELNEVDISDISPTLSATSSQNVFRDDNVDEENKDVAKRLVQSAPDSENGYIKVKSILK
ncbi:MAG: Asp-tRNA(Asn)/Glu-tRNA(Gln) amidotransferase subunit GatC [Patescibacteria group bacterium]